MEQLKKTCRRWLAAVALIAAATNCQAQSVDYHILGTWQGGDGQKILLKTVYSSDDIKTTDSTVVKNGAYEFKGTLPQMMRLELSGKPGKQRLFADGSGDIVANVIEKTYTRRGKTSTGLTFEVAPSPEQQCIEEQGQISLMHTLMKFGSLIALSNVLNDSTKDSIQIKHDVDSIQSNTAKMDSALNLSIDSFIVRNRDNYAITYFIGEFIAKNYPYKELAQRYAQLTDRVRNSLLGKELKAKVDAMQKVNIGGIAPDIEQPTPNGKMLKLSSLRGKYVLLDFWASWCGPCLGEMPNVKHLYAKYHKKGLEIYGVSLDDKADKWKAAIAKHELKWNHVSSLKGWNCPVAKEYNVTGIPRMYIIDPSGRIIAQDLRGEDLANKMAELFDGKK